LDTVVYLEFVICNLDFFKAMGILDKLGIRKKKAIKSGTDLQIQKPDAVPKKTEAKDLAVRQKREKIGSQNSYQILIKPIVSEKGTALAGSGRYVFAVMRSANKSEIKKSVQVTYDVDVESVKIIKVPGKFRRYGRTTGRTSSWKKAIVTVKKGQKIPGIIEAVG